MTRRPRRAGAARPSPGSRPIWLCWSQHAETGTPEAKALVTRALQHWKVDTDLAGIRDEEALKTLTEDERKTCRTLWAEVDTILKKAQP